MFNIFKKKLVVLDTNFLLIPGELGIDIFTEISRIMQEPHTICVLSSTIEELNKLIIKNGKKKEGFNAKLGYIMIKQKKIKVINTKNEYADKDILDLAEKKDIIVATQDKELKTRLKKLKKQVILLKQKKYLEIQ
ncbi:MAG: PIN domain-containing protein [Candidatus Woesearchaeota archaeon]